MPLGEKFLLCLRSSCSMGDDSAQGSSQQAAPAVLSLKLPSPDSPQAPLVHSALPLPEPRVSGCKLNFVGWPFKRLPASLTITPWQTETLLLFTIGCDLGSFPALVLQAGEPSLGFRPHTSCGGTPPATETSLQHFSCSPWGPSQPAHIPSALPASTLW